MSQKESYAINQTYTGAYQLSWGNQIQTIVFIDPAVNRLAFPEVKEPGRVNGYLKKFLTFCDVPNLPYVEPPPIGVETSRSEAYSIQKSIEWHSPGFGIVLWKTKLSNPRADPEYGDWNCVGYHSVINTGVWRQYDSYPVFSGNLTDDLQEGDRIGISLESRWVNGVEYFARVTPPYAMPDNRPDKITFDVSWVQDLVIAKKDAQPIFMYVTSYASGTSSPPVQQKPPIVSLNIGANPISQELYTFDKTAFTLEISDLTPEVDYIYQWLVGTNLLGNPVTARSDTKGKASIPFTSEMFKNAPFPGTGAYAVRVTQGTLSTDSNAITVRHPTCRIKTDPVSVASGRTWVAWLYDLKANQSVSLTMMKNGVDLSGWSITRTPALNTGTTPNPWEITAIDSLIFNQTSWGVDTNEPYQFKATINGVTIVSPSFKVVTYIAPAKG